MPRIPGPQDVRQTRAPRDTGVRNAGAVSEAVADVGETLFNVSNQLRERRQQAEDTGFRARYNAEIQKEAQRLWQENKDMAVNSPEEFTATFDQQLQGRGLELQEELRRNGFRPSEQALNMANVDLTQVRGDWGVKAISYENNVRTLKLIDEAKGSLEDLELNAYNNPETADLSLKQGMRIIQDIEGHDPEVASTLRETFTGGLTISAVNGLINKDPGEALARLKSGEFDENLDATAKDQLIDRAETEHSEVSLVAESQRETDRIVRQHADVSSALKDARQIEDPELRDKTVARVKVRFSEKAAIQQGYQEQISRNAWDVVERGGSPDDIPQSTWLDLDPKERIDIRQHYEDRISGKTIQTDWGAWHELTQMASNPETQSEFARVNLYKKYRRKLSDTEFKSLVDMQQEVRSKLRGDDFDETDLTDVRNTNQIVDDTLRDLDIDPSPDEGTPDATVAREFRRLTQDEITALERQEKRKATAQEKQQIVDDLSMQFTSEGFFGFMFPDDEATVADEVPAKYYQPIADALRRAGVPVTGENIYRMYRDMKERGEID